MKRLPTIVLVSSITSLAAADTVWFEVDLADLKQEYDPGDIIKINVVGDDWASGFFVSAITSDNGGTATGSRFFNPIFYVDVDVGTLVNGGDPYVLISTIHGGNRQLSGDPVPYYYYFVFQIPDVPEPSWLTIDDYGLTSIGALGFWEDNNISALQLHVTPEPTTILLLGFGAVMLRSRCKV